MVRDERIDHGNAFDWGRASADYARYRDVYPPLFYEKLLATGVAAKGQQVLDIGTGTGVLPRHLYDSGAHFTGIDLSAEQIAQATALAAANGQDIRFLCGAAEQLPFADNTFDAVTACQCLFYFQHEQLAPLLARILKPQGLFAVLYMEWLPYEDAVAGQTEELILRYNPSWTGSGETVRETELPAVYGEWFTEVSREVFRLDVPFTRESWNGRIRACRGIGASLPPEALAQFDAEHMALLRRIAPEAFTVRHFATLNLLRVNK